MGNRTTVYTVKAFLGAAVCAFSTLAFSQPYMGISIGRTSTDGAQGGSFEIWGGYRLLEYLAVEGAYLDLGRFSAGNWSSGVKTEVQGFHLAVVAFLPVSEQVELFTKLGGYMLETTYTSNGGYYDLRGSTRDELPTLGFGAAWTLADRFAVTAEYRSIDGEMNNISLGGRVSF